MADNISLRIALEGAAEVQNKLKQLATEGESMLRKLQQSTGGLGDLGGAADRSTREVSAATSRLGAVTQAFQRTTPAVEQLGKSFLGLGVFASSARFGIAGLAAALAGGLGVAAAKSADEVAAAKQKLSDSLRSDDLGQKAFQSLSEAAKRLGVDVKELVSGYAALSAASKKLGATVITPKNRHTPEGGVEPIPDVIQPGAVRGIEQNTVAYENLFKLIRSGTRDNKAAAQAANEFGDSLRDGGKASDVFEKLAGSSRKAADEILKNLGRGFQGADDAIKRFKEGATGKITTDEVIKALEKTGAAAEEADRKSRSFTVAMDGLKSALANFGGAGDGFERLGQGITGMVDTIANKIREVSAAFQRLLQEAGVFSAVGDAVKAVGDAFAQVGNIIGQGIQSQISVARIAIEGLVTAFQQMNSGIETGFQLAQQGAQAFVDHVKQVFQQMVSHVSQLGAAIGDGIVQGFETAKNAILQIIETIKDAWRSLTGGGGDTGDVSLSDGAPTQGFARGGFTGFGGKYEPAGIVHRGEYVEPMHVVRQPGVLSFLEALRRSGGDLQRTIAAFQGSSLRLDRLRGFNLGGLVTGMEHAMSNLPGFSEGGLVEALAEGGGGIRRDLHPVTINLGKHRVIEGLYAPEKILRDLHRMAIIDAGQPRTPSRGSARG